MKKWITVIAAVITPVTFAGCGSVVTSAPQAYSKAMQPIVDQYNQVGDDWNTLRRYTNNLNKPLDDTTAAINHIVDEINKIQDEHKKVYVPSNMISTDNYFNAATTDMVTFLHDFDQALTSGDSSKETTASEYLLKASEDMTQWELSLKQQLAY